MPANIKTIYDWTTDELPFTSPVMDDPHDDLEEAWNLGSRNRVCTVDDLKGEVC